MSPHPAGELRFRALDCVGELVLLAVVFVERPVAPLTGGTAEPLGAAPAAAQEVPCRAAVGYGMQGLRPGVARAPESLRRLTALGILWKWRGHGIGKGKFLSPKTVGINDINIRAFVHLVLSHYKSISRI